ncbi:MAG: sulfotransferase domain-containing protein [Cytophagales bacterium]|nr:sulfotransferase domain-containing protein [Cytophagales bacterium]
MLLPNLIIIGPPKCGTTSVFDWLSKHPDTCPSKVKETNYFLDWVGKHNEEANFINHGLDKYESLFHNYKNQPIVFESSPGYLRSDTPLREFAKLNPKPFILFIYRDPTERLYSEFRFSKFKTRSFIGTFQEYCKDDLSGKNVLDGKIVTLINHWLTNYDTDKFIIRHFDELKTNPKEFMESLCERIGIDPGYYSDFKFDAKNKTVIRRSNRFHGFANKFYKLFPDWAKNVIVPIYRIVNQTDLPKPTKEDLIVIDRLKEYYKDETWENIQV